MSDNDAPTETGGEASNGMTAEDVKFLVACLRNTTGGNIQINLHAVAESLGYKNHRSVGNKIAALKKKYSLPFGTASTVKATGVPGSGVMGDNGTPASRKKTGANVEAPGTPSKVSGGRVKKTAAKKTAKRKPVKSEGEDDEEEKEELDVKEELDIKMEEHSPANGDSDDA